MRIRLSLTLDIERRRDAIDEHEHRDLDTLVERAEPHRIGFVPDHERRDPDERAR